MRNNQIPFVRIIRRKYLKTTTTCPTIITMSTITATIIPPTTAKR